jgi:50S ribosomal protein L16 3-hydroxylase
MPARNIGRLAASYGDPSMIFKNTNLTPQQFLADYWQKRPLLIRQAFPGFIPELDENDIAGLACDELAESRLVTGSYPEHDWKLRHGPFTEEDFGHFPDSGWTLLVQDVEKHYPPLHEFMREFSFLPRWRIDDLMVSVAGPGGSVGPHVDQYDVFLLQAQGSRRWQIAESFKKDLLPNCELNVLQAFTPEQEWTLEPGDMLYLPPGIAHHGVALDQGMTWSVGMRAPSAADLFQTLGEWLATDGDEGGRYRDSGLKAALRSGEIDDLAIGRFRDFFRTRDLGGEKFSAFLGVFLSNYRLAHEPAPPAVMIDPDGLLKSLEQGRILKHNPWSRLLWIESKNGASLFAAGTAYSCTLDSAQIICDPDRLGRFNHGLAKPELTLLCELLNRGHLYLEPL